MISTEIASPLKTKKQTFRGLKTEAGQTLFYHHIPLMKWDWDLLEDNGVPTGHGEYKATITHREQPRQIVAQHCWSRQQVWAFVDSFGGVNAYCLSQKMFLAGMSRQELRGLQRAMHECCVDPTYIDNLQKAQTSHWSWCSRVWPKTWRPQETWIGKPKYIWVASEGALENINPSLQKEFERVLRMYAVHSDIVTSIAAMPVITG